MNTGIEQWKNKIVSPYSLNLEEQIQFYFVDKNCWDNMKWKIAVLESP